MGSEIRIDGIPHEDVVIWPHVDLDTTFVWVDGVPTQIVTTGLGKTTTDILTWVDGELQSDAVVVI